MHRTFSRPVYRWLAGVSAVALIALSSCGSSEKKTVPASLFRDWFVAPGTNPPGELEHASRRVLDSLRLVIREQSKAGNGSTVLADTSGTRYTVGYGTPVSCKNDSLYPCIIYLHGGIGTTRNDKGEHAWKMLQMLSDSMDLFFASPSANRTAPWWSPAGLSRILQTLRFMTMHFPIDPDKVFLVGVSDGATGCWAAANTIAAPFAGFISISGFGGMLSRFGMELHPENLMQRPLYNINAGKDRLYPLAAVRQFLDRLERQGVGIRRKEYPDEEHGFDYRDLERGTLCMLLRTWSLPEFRGVNWHLQGTYPGSIAGVLSLERNGSGPCFVREFNRNDTIYIQTGGIGGLQLYFDGNGSERSVRRFSINGTRASSIRPQTPDGTMVLQYMKQRCFPIIIDGVVYTIPL